LVSRHKKIILISLFAALTAIGSFLRIPFPYVPFTLQTFFVILSGDILGPKYGAYSQIIYIAIGLFGLPIFAYGGGIGYILQPSFGYVLAYPLGALICGTFIHHNIRFKRSQNNAALMVKVSLFNIFGLLSIFAIGLIYLYLNLRFIVGQDIESMRLLWSGLIVFIPGDLIKVLLASWMTIKLYPYLGDH